VKKKEKIFVKFFYMFSAFDEESVNICFIE
jgi:hypothetical protein